MADWSDGISWQRSPTAFGGLKLPQNPQGTPQDQAMKQILQQLEQQRASQNQQRQGVYGVNNKPYTMQDAEALGQWLPKQKTMQLQPNGPIYGDGRDAFNNMPPDIVDTFVKDPAAGRKLWAEKYPDNYHQHFDGAEVLLSNRSQQPPAFNTPVITPPNVDPRMPQVSASPAFRSNMPVQGIDRSAFSGELQNPALRQQLASLAYRETGGQGPQAQQAFLETIFNRASARGKSLSDTISGRDGYFPSVSLRPADPSLSSGLSPLIDTVSRGSNVSNGATGNASGGVGFNGGDQTFSAGGERFGREGPDRNWKVPYLNSNQQQPQTNAFYGRDGSDGYQKDRGMMMQTPGAGWRDAPPMTGQSTMIPSDGAGYRDSPPFQTAKMQTPDSYRQNFGAPSAPAPQTSSWNSNSNGYRPAAWDANGGITWGDGTRQQVSAFQ